MFGKLLHLFWPQPGPPPDRVSLAVAALLRTEAAAQEAAGIDLRPSRRIPDNSKDLGADRTPRTRASLTKR
jgi:hypothetical protein